MSDQRMAVFMESAHQGHEELLKLWRWTKSMLISGNKMTVEARKVTRSAEQNAMLWSILTDISAQVSWPVDGAMSKLDPTEWKDILTAGQRNEQRVAQGIGGGFVMLGQRTSKMTKAELSELLELAWAFGSQQDVRWSRTSLGRDVPDKAVA